MKSTERLNTFAITSCIIGGLIGCQPAPSDGHEQVGTTQENLYLYRRPWDLPVLVCFENGTNDLKSKVKFHLLNTWTRAANVTFWGWDTCDHVGNQSHVAVKFVNDTNGSCGPVGMVLPGDNHGKTSVTLLQNDPDPTYAHLRYEIIHEFGHALGFAHEQERPDNWNKSGQPIYCDQLDQGRKALPGGDYQTPSFDNLSIMNYCVCRYSTCVNGFKTFLSGWDIAGARWVYGVGPRYFKGDLWGNGQTDILWHNGSTGATQVWYMDGITMTSQFQVDPRYVVPDSSGWRLSGTGDFNYDGNVDLVWHNGVTGATQVWYMSGFTMTSQAQVDPRYLVPDSSGWRFAGTGDLNYDGKVDLLWHNGATGATQVWYMNGITMASQAQVDPRYLVRDSSGWRFAGVGDFNYDGKDDLVWHNGATGATQVWFMDGSTMASQAQVDPRYSVPDSSGWSLAGIGDFNYDQKVDLLWHNGTTGVTQVWYMNGTTMASQAQVDPRYLVRDSSGWRPAGNT